MLTLLKTRWRSLCVFFILIIGIQVIGNLTTFQSVTTWYPTLKKAPWSPPNWLFGPVWTILYMMLALNGWLLWNRVPRDKFKQPIMLCYFAQLFFNAWWSPLFFGFHQTEIALACLVLLDVFAVSTMILAFKNNHKEVGWMFIPYCLWVLFATSLNAAIVVLN